MGAGVARVESIPLAGLECYRCICLPPTGSWCLPRICCAQCTCMNGASALHLLSLVHLQDSGICFASVVPYRMQGLGVCLASVVLSPPAGFKCVPCICCAHTGCKIGMFHLRSIQSARRQTFVLQLFSPYHMRGLGNHLALVECVRSAWFGYWPYSCPVGMQPSGHSKPADMSRGGP